MKTETQSTNEICCRLYTLYLQLKRVLKSTYTIVLIKAMGVYFDLDSLFQTQYKIRDPFVVKIFQYAFVEY